MPSEARLSDSAAAQLAERPHGESRVVLYVCISLLLSVQRAYPATARSHALPQERAPQRGGGGSTLAGLEPAPDPTPSPRLTGLTLEPAPAGDRA